MNCRFDFLSAIIQNSDPSSDHRREDFFVRVTETNNAYLCRTENLISKVMLKALHLTDTSEEKIYTE